MIEQDRLLRMFVQHQVKRLGSLESLRKSDINTIGTEPQSIARLIIATKSSNTLDGDLFQLIAPELHDVFVRAVRRLGVQSGEQLALTLGISLKQLTLLKIADCIKTGSESDQQQAETLRSFLNHRELCVYPPQP